MLKINLLENNYNFERKMPNKWLITMLWTFLNIICLAPSFLIARVTLMLHSPDRFHFVDLGNAANIFIFCAIVFIYFFMKIRMTSVFCHDKKQSMNFKVIKEDGVPVVACKEALTARQIILIHTVPVIIAYSLLCVLVTSAAVDILYQILLFGLSFVMAYDFALVICVLYMKARYKPDYIAVNHHIYDMTLYTK